MKRSFALLALAIVMLASACGSSDTTTTSDSPATTDASSPTDSAPVDGGVLRVQLEEVQGFFTEGFEVGLRFENADGTTLGTLQWTDWVAGTDPSDPAAYYESVYKQAVPAGTVVVLGSANVGIGPAPEKPDVSGDLHCRLEIEVGANETVDVEVSFDGTTDCLRLATPTP